MPYASCSKLLIKASCRRRLFCVFHPDKPYLLTLTYRRRVPRTTGGSGVGMVVGDLTITDTPSIDFTKDRVYRVESVKAAESILADIRTNRFCYKCGHTSQCTKGKLYIPTNLC